MENILINYMTLKQLIHEVNLDISDVIIQRDYGTSLEQSFVLTPEDFLVFSEEDLASDNEHAHINALSNAKRAIECQIDKVLLTFGITYKKKGFPDKQKLLQNIGITAPNILRKIFKKRNEMEHKYYCPERSEVEEAVELASLFIDACNRTLNPFWSFYISTPQIELTGRLKDCLYFDYDEKNKYFKVRGFKQELVGTLKVSQKHKAYLPIIKLSIALNRKKDIKKCLREFFNIVG